MLPLFRRHATREVFRRFSPRLRLRYFMLPLYTSVAVLALIYYAAFDAAITLMLRRLYEALCRALRADIRQALRQLLLLLRRCRERASITRSADQHLPRVMPPIARYSRRA